MADTRSGLGKVELKVGNITFSGEGDQDWLERQLANVLDAASQGEDTSQPSGDPLSDREPIENAGFETSLASYIKRKGGDNKQVQRFLVTAAWLWKRGRRSLKASDIAKALLDNHQKRLANPADCLNKNVAKGYCEKTAEGFFITPEGWSALGDEPE